jgi:hypothetical protein
LAGLNNIPELTNDIKMSIIIYLKNVLKNKIDQKIFTKEQVLEIIKSFITLILTENLGDNLLQNLNLTLTNILNSSYITGDSNIIVGLCSTLKEYTFNLAGSDYEKISRFKPVIYLFQIIISSAASNNENIYDIITKQLEVVDSMINIIKSKLNLKEDKNVVVLRYIYIN